MTFFKKYSARCSSPGASAYFGGARVGASENSLVNGARFRKVHRRKSPKNRLPNSAEGAFAEMVERLNEVQSYDFHWYLYLLNTRDLNQTEESLPQSNIMMIGNKTYL